MIIYLFIKIKMKLSTLYQQNVNNFIYKQFYFYKHTHSIYPHIF